MKIAPIQREMAKHNSLVPFLVHTGQHYDDKMSKFFLEDLELPRPDAYLGVGSGSHAEQTARIMIEFEKVVDHERPDLVVVVGDVNSTAACSLVAAKKGIRIAHVEAGLRSFDRTMPEEINRIVTDSIADYLFVTEQSGMDNLRNEGVAEDKIFFTGNVMIDSLLFFLEKAENSAILSSLELNGYPYVLITMHRPSNVDQKEIYQRILDTFRQIQKQVKIVFPMHPRSRKMLEMFGFEEQVEEMQNLIIIDPIGYLDFIKLMRHATMVLTDSGGIQEETTYLGIPCLTMRDNTERPVTVEIGTNEIVGSNVTRIIEMTNEILAGRIKKGQIPELWDGKAAQRIIDIIAGN
jgi:UDP-N-acetylglucosamine 2-epimerase (non-hydrolysing)